MNTLTEFFVSVWKEIAIILRGWVACFYPQASWWGAVNNVSTMPTLVSIKALVATWRRERER